MLLFCIQAGTTQVEHRSTPSPPLFIHRIYTGYTQVIHRLPMLARFLHGIRQGDPMFHMEHNLSTGYTQGECVYIVGYLCTPLPLYESTG